MSAYWLGFFTLPALAALGAGLFFAWVVVGDWLAIRHGFTFEVKGNRAVHDVSDYVLRHDIWWERSWGPFFAGCWYREPDPSAPLATRWIGIGSTEGPCWMAFRKQVLTRPTSPGASA